MATGRCQDDLCLRPRRGQSRNFTSIATNSLAMSVDHGLDSVVGDSVEDDFVENESLLNRRALSEPAGDGGSSGDDEDGEIYDVGGDLPHQDDGEASWLSSGTFSSSAAVTAAASGSSSRCLFPIAEADAASGSSGEAPSCSGDIPGADSLSPLSPQEDLELKYRLVSDTNSEIFFINSAEIDCTTEQDEENILSIADCDADASDFESPIAEMQQRRRDRGGIAIRHRLSAISEASDDRATSSADDEEINTSIAEVREFHEQFGRDSGGRSSASHRSGKRFATLMRPQPEGLAGEPLTQRVTQLDEQRDYQPALLGLPGLPAGGLVTAVASSSARILDCTSATAPAAAASEEEVEVRVTAEATGPNPSVALARAAARAAGAASAAVKKSRSVRSHCVNASEAESEYRIFISTSCTLREPQRLDGDGKLKNVMSSTQPPTEEDIVEIFQVAPELQEYQRWAVTGAGDVEFTFISDSEPGSPTPDVEENPQPSSRSQQQSALLQATPGQQQEQQQQQQRGRLPGPNSLQADQRRLQAARDAYAAVKTVPARPRPSLSLPRLSNSVSNGAAGATSVVNHQRWSDVSTSSGSLRQLRRLLGDDEAVYASHSMTDGLVVDQQQSRELQQRSQPSVTAPKSVSLSDLLDSDVGNSGSIDADVSHSCASLLETDNINTLTSNESLKQSLKRLKLPSSRRAAADQAKVRSASLFFEWLEQRANSERERSICRSLTRLEAPVWLDNLAKDAPGPLDTSLRVKENRNSWRPSATSIEPSSLIKGSVDDITWKTRPIHGSLSLPMRLSKQTNRSSDHGKASSTDGNLRIKQTSAGTDRLDGSISNRARFFTESSLSRQVRQAAAAQPRPPTLSELAARLHRPPLLPVTLTPEDFQPKARAQTMPEEIQPMSSSDASAGQKRDSGASMASLTSSSSTTSTSSNSQSSSATTSSETGNSEAAEKTEESTVVQTSIVQVYTRVLHPTVNHGPVTQHSDAELLPGLLACQVDPTGPSTENDLMTAPKLLKLAEAQIERQRSRLAEWQNDAAEGRPTTARQEELLAVNDEVLRYFRVNSGGPDRADRRPESPSLAYDDVLQVLGDYEASSKLSRVLVALSGTRERKLQQPQRSLAEACHGVIREGQHYLLECANPSCARRCDLDRRLANGFHSCRECRTFYCSQKCRSDHARAHGRSCCWNRRVDACKRVIAGCLLADTSPAVVLLSRLARASSRSFGWRGCLLLALRDSAAAARFVTTDGKEGLMRPPALLDLSTLSGDLADASKSCNPDAAFVVCVVVGTGVKWAKLRLSARTKPDADTTEEDADADRRRRWAYLSRVERLLRERGVSLRRQFPQLRERLVAYAETGAPFLPAVVYPTDRATGRAFACRLAPDREPELEWVPLAVAVAPEEPASSVGEVVGDAPRAKQRQPPFYRRRRVVSTDL